MKKRFILAPLTTVIFSAYRRLMRRDVPFKKAVVKNLAQVGLSPATVTALPRWGYHSNGKPMEWMNLIFIGQGEALSTVLTEAGWYEAEPATPWVWVKAFFAILFNIDYHHGPFTTVFVENQPQKHSYQKPTEQNGFSQRHHARFWATPFVSLNGKPVWIGHSSFDSGVRGSGPFSFLPVHEIDAAIDNERKFIVGDMLKAGASLRGYIQFQPAGEGVNAYGDQFHSDGRVAVMEVSY